MHTFNPFGTPLAVMMIILLVAGTVVGLAVSGIDLLNPWTSQANANNIAVKTSHEENTYQQQERRAAAETDAHIEQTRIQTKTARAQAEANIQHQNQMNAIAESFFSTLASIIQSFLAGVGAMLPISIPILTISYAVRIVIKSYTPAHQKPPKTFANFQNQGSSSFDLWKYKDYRQAKVAEAKLQEQKARENALRNKPVTWQDLLSKRDD